MAGTVPKRNRTSPAGDTLPSPALPVLDAGSTYLQPETPSVRRPSPAGIPRQLPLANAARRPAGPLTHIWIWSAIDTLAERHGLTPSGLARSAGLDPTAFNRSKRLTAEGRPRWPSTESIAKVLEATGTTLNDFAALEFEGPSRARVPIGALGPGDVADFNIVAEIRDGIVQDWDPTPARRTAANGNVVLAPPRRRLAITVADTSLEPVYSLGNVLVASEAAEPRAGDRVLVKPSAMPVLPRVLLAAGTAHIELGSLTDSTQSICVRRCDLDWMARIILVCQ